MASRLLVLPAATIWLLLHHAVAVTPSTSNDTTPEIIDSYITRTEFKHNLDELGQDLNAAWTLMATFLIFFMQTGFAFFEAGAVRRKNVQSILMKTLLDTSASLFGFYITGYGLAYGDDKTKPTRNWFMGNADFAPGDTFDNWVLFFFQWSFSSTATTIVSGAVAERCLIHSYLLYAAMITAITYPITVHWMWSSAGIISPFNRDFIKLGRMGVIDFSGCGPVHMVGGVSALIAALILGPRKGRYSKTRIEKEWKPFSLPFMVLGVFILWFGWLGFNCGSTAAIYGLRNATAKIGVNTMMSSAAGSLTCLYIGKMYTKRLELTWCLNGVLAGCVSITSCCSTADPMGAAIIGFLGSFVYVFGAKFITTFKIDDPLEAIPVHCFCGMWGLIAPGFFATEHNARIIYGYDNPTYGLLYGGGFEQLGLQLLAAVALIIWVTLNTGLIFITMKYTIGFRIPEQAEDVGMDVYFHGDDEPTDSPGTISAMTMQRSKGSSHNYARTTHSQIV